MNTLSVITVTCICCSLMRLKYAILSLSGFLIISPYSPFCALLQCSVPWRKSVVISFSFENLYRTNSGSKFVCHTIPTFCAFSKLLFAMECTVFPISLCLCFSCYLQWIVQQGIKLPSYYTTDKLLCKESVNCRVHLIEWLVKDDL